MGHSVPLASRGPRCASLCTQTAANPGAGGGGAWVARAQGHGPHPHRETARLRPPGGLRGPASSLPSRLQAASHPPSVRRATGGPLGSAGDTLGARSPSANTGGLSGVVGFHQGKKQTRRECLFCDSVCGPERDSWTPATTVASKARDQPPPVGIELWHGPRRRDQPPGPSPSHGETRAGPMTVPGPVALPGPPCCSRRQARF